MNNTGTPALTRARLAFYAALSLPLAFVGLPIYVHIPHYYATVHNVDLVTISMALLAVRFVDAFQDPLIGTLSDRTRTSRRTLIIAASVPLMLGFVGLFNPPGWESQWLAWWMVAMLLIVYTSFSTAIINFYAAGLALSRDSRWQTRISAAREGMLLLGVILAAALPSLLKQQFPDATAFRYFSYIFVPIAIAATISTVLALRGAPQAPSMMGQSWLSQFSLLKDRLIRRVFLLFFINSMPTAVTSTLFLFFTEDVLGAKEQAGYLLICFFFGAACSVTLWSWLAARYGRRLVLLGAMILAIGSFIWAFTLGRGDVMPFYIISFISGMAVGADLTLMPALFSDILHERDHQGGVAFSLWHFLNKLNLSLAAGIVLPVLSLFEYQPGETNTPDQRMALAAAYALFPCLLKLGAIWLTARLPDDRPHVIATKEKAYD